MIFSASSFMPSRWCKSARSTGFHHGQSGQDVCEVFSNVDLRKRSTDRHRVVLAAGT
jgi:hypothetical protein